MGKGRSPHSFLFSMHYTCVQVRQMRERWWEKGTRAWEGKKEGKGAGNKKKSCRVLAVKGERERKLEKRKRKRARWWNSWIWIWDLYVLLHIHVLNLFWVITWSTGAHCLCYSFGCILKRKQKAASTVIKSATLSVFYICMWLCREGKQHLYQDILCLYSGKEKTSWSKQAHGISGFHSKELQEWISFDKSRCAIWFHDPYESWPNCTFQTFSVLFCRRHATPTYCWLEEEM